MCIFSQPVEAFQAANVQKCADNWSQINAPEVILNWLRNGIHIPFVTEPGRFQLPNRTLGFAKSQFVVEELRKLVK